jgi:26 proteasome complex subunit DSS1
VEEDDEFEEFTPANWTAPPAESDEGKWQTSWDQDDIEDDFTAKLRAELEKNEMCTK